MLSSGSLRFCRAGNGETDGKGGLCELPQPLPGSVPPPKVCVDCRHTPEVNKCRITKTGSTHLCRQPFLCPRCTRALKRSFMEKSSFTLKKSGWLRGSLSSPSPAAATRTKTPIIAPNLPSWQGQEQSPGAGGRGRGSAALTGTGGPGGWGRGWERHRGREAAVEPGGGCGERRTAVTLPGTARFSPVSPSLARFSSV